MAKDATKVVVRLLPPLITEDELLSTISEESQKNAASRTFIPGKRHKGEKASRNAVCYFNFSAEEFAELFIKEYHGHQFVDDQGEQFRAVACYSPYQKYPKKKEAKDPREGTIEEDKEYKEFVENLSKPKEAFVAPDNPALSLKPAEPGQTPLLQYMKNKAKERRARLEKRKNQRWRGEGGLEYIAEEETVSSKKAKWHCAECGTSKNLEEDPDDRGSFYCLRCWESWESSYSSAPTTKKKKKKSSYYEGDYAEEPAAASTSKKSKKKRDKEAAADDWGTTKTSKDDGTESKHRRKKKEKYDKYWEEEWEEEPSSYWRAKKKDKEWEEEDYPKSKKDKKHRDEWAEEETPSRRKKGNKHDKGDGVVVSRWKAKKSGEEESAEKEEKPRHSRKKDRDSEGGAQWVPKNR